LNELYLRNQPGPIEFGVGYRWYGNQSNLLLATRIAPAPEVTASISKDQTPRKVEIETVAVTPTAAATAVYGPAPRATYVGPFPFPYSYPSGSGRQCWVSTDEDRGYGYHRSC
jgi:hypothetical protein